MNKKYLFMMMGHAGSGKSYFARQLADELGLVRLNGDSLRVAMYESLQEVKRYSELDPSLMREKIFNGLDYAVAQVLLAGHSVIYDSNNNKSKSRLLTKNLAEKHGANAIIIWVQTPPELAIKRSQEREELIDQRKFDEKRARETIKRHIDNTDEPNEDEKTIKVDGTIPFGRQFISFKEQLLEMDNE